MGKYANIKTSKMPISPRHITPQLGAQIRRLKYGAKRREPTCLCPSERSERLYWLVSYRILNWITVVRASCF